MSQQYHFSSSAPDDSFPPCNCKPNAEQQKSGKENKGGRRRCVLRFWRAEVLQVKVQPVSPSAWLQLGVPLTPTSNTFACAKKPCVEVLRHLSPPSACVVDQAAICLSAYESSFSHSRRGSCCWCVVSVCKTCFFRRPGLFPGEIFAQGGVWK